MVGLKKLTLMEFKVFLRNPTGAFFTIIFPLMLILVFGSIYGNGANPDFGGYGIVDVYVPSFTGMIVAVSALTVLNTDVATAREKGILRRLKATPLRPLTILTAKVAMVFSITSIAMVLIAIWWPWRPRLRSLRI